MYLYQQNFQMVEIDSICRQQNKTDLKINFALGRVENILGKGENAGYQHFLLFPQCFQKASFSEFLTLSQTSPGFYVSAVQVF